MLIERALGPVADHARRDAEVFAHLARMVGAVCDRGGADCGPAAALRDALSKGRAEE
jgi:hypothetical protein